LEVEATTTSIGTERVRHWVVSGGLKCPSAISIECPFCREVGVFALGVPSVDKSTISISVSPVCPGCSQKPVLTFYYGHIASSDEISAPSAMYIFPSSRKFYPPLLFDSTVPEGLTRAINDAVAAYNRGIYPAAAVSGRRALEGMFKLLVPDNDKKKPLAQLIDLVSNGDSLSEPLRTLSHAIREGGNLGAHFDLETDPDEALARAMVELLDYLSSYLYALPKKIERLEAQLIRK
jgi:Domain of unknown function (DUF4145)